MRFNRTVAGPRLGLVGLGAIGGGLARSLLRNDFGLRCYARHPAKLQPFVEQGAMPATSLSGLAAESDLVLLSLPDTAAVEEVIFGRGGLAEGMTPGGMIVDTSTIDVVAAREIARALGDRQVMFLDAPVSGGQAAAQAGTLTCMVGGDQGGFDRALPVLRGFASAVTYLGGSGSGQIGKVCNQLCVLANLVAAAEMVTLCRRLGMDPVPVREALLGGSARSAVLERHARRMIEGDFVPGARAELLLKDIGLVTRLMEEAGLQSALASSAKGLFEALVSRGQGQLDMSAIVLAVGELPGAPDGVQAAGRPPVTPP